MRAFIHRHPVAGYFVLAILVSWGGVAAIILPGSIPASAADASRLFVPVYLAMLVGPSVAGLAITATTGGTRALREFRSRLFAWRIPMRWYAVALLTAPAAIALTIGALSLGSPDFLPAFWRGDDYQGVAGPIQATSATSFLFTALAVGIGAGFFEELGWTGVAVPRLLANHGILETGVGVGLVWGAWHYLAIHWGSIDAIGSVPAPVYLLIALFAFLPPYRILMAWAYRHTESLFVGILMHASLTSSMLILGPAVSGRALLAYDLTLGGMFWIVAALVLFRESRQTQALKLRSVNDESPPIGATAQSARG